MEGGGRRRIYLRHGDKKIIFEFEAFKQEKLVKEEKNEKLEKEVWFGHSDINFISF